MAYRSTLNNQTLEEVAQFVNPFVRGWVNYYAKFYPSAVTPILRSLERSLLYWVRRKFKRMRYHQRQAIHWLGRVTQREPDLFVLWSHGIRSATEHEETDEPRGSRPVLGGTGGAIPPGYSTRDRV